MSRRSARRVSVTTSSGNNSFFRGSAPMEKESYFGPISTKVIMYLHYTYFFILLTVIQITSVESNILWYRLFLFAAISYIASVFSEYLGTNVPGAFLVSVIPYTYMLAISYSLTGKLSIFWSISVNIAFTQSGHRRAKAYMIGHTIMRQIIHWIIDITLAPVYDPTCPSVASCIGPKSLSIIVYVLMNVWCQYVFCSLVDFNSQYQIEVYLKLLILSYWNARNICQSYLLQMWN